MAQTRKKWVAFRTNAMIPASVVGGGKDRKMQAGEPVQLPEAYADHVVHDGFAVFCDALRKTAPKKSGGQSADEKAAAEAAARLAAAQARVDGLKASIEALPGDAPAQGDLLAELAGAEAELAALRPVS